MDGCSPGRVGLAVVDGDQMGVVCDVRMSGGYIFTY